jgi:Flp pilus assembly pilin Flp
MVLYVMTWLQLLADRRAMTALEYGLIAGIVVATVVTGFTLMADVTVGAGL